MENSPSPSSNERKLKACKSVAPLSEQSPFEILSDEPERINPAILLADEMIRKQISETLDFEDIRRAEETISKSRFEIGRIEVQFAALVKTPPRAGAKIPVGF